MRPKVLASSDFFSFGFVSLFLKLKASPCLFFFKKTRTLDLNENLLKKNTQKSRKIMIFFFFFLLIFVVVDVNCRIITTGEEGENKEKSFRIPFTFFEEEEEKKKNYRKKRKSRAEI